MRIMNELNEKKGVELRDLGIKKSIDNADEKHLSWSGLAYQFLIKYSKLNKTFMAEDVRIASNLEIPEPPSNRAWGGVFLSAKNNKIIQPIGFGIVKNPKAHRTPATLWKSNLI